MHGLHDACGGSERALSTPLIELLAMAGLPAGAGSNYWRSSWTTDCWTSRCAACMSRIQVIDDHIHDLDRLMGRGPCRHWHMHGPICAGMIRDFKPAEQHGLVHARRSALMHA